MRTRALQNIIALLILGGSLIFGFLPRTDLFPIKINVYIQGDTFTFKQIEQEFQEGVRDLQIVVDNYLSASAFFGDLLLTQGKHQLVFNYLFNGNLLDSKDLLFEPSGYSSIRVEVNRIRILNLEAK